MDKCAMVNKAARRYADGGAIDQLQGIGAFPSPRQPGMAGVSMYANGAGTTTGLSGTPYMTSTSGGGDPVQSIGQLPQQPGAVPQPAPLSTGSTDLDTLGTPQGSAPKFALQTMAEKAVAAGFDPHAPTVPAAGIGAPPLARGRRLAQNIMTPVDQLFAPRAFAEGGAINETPEQKIARISAQYGIHVGATPAAQAPVAPAPTPQAEPQNQGIGKGIFNILRGRKAQIDAASGYAHGGKIKGPGTPTSDSIPAMVQQTGEPIKVSTGERIVSKAQDAYLTEMAQKMGFDSLDAMLEHGTGSPVGPTVKGGVAHAATGYSSDEWKSEGLLGKLAAGQLDLPKPEGQIRVNTNASGVYDPAATLSANAEYEKNRKSNYSNEGRIAQGDPRNPSAASSPAVAPQQASQETGNGFVGRKMASLDDGSYMVKGTATQDATRMQAPDGGGYITGANGKAIFLPGGQSPSPVNPGVGIAADVPRDAYGNDMTRTNAMKAQLAQMERERYGRDMQADITSPQVRTAAMQNIERLNNEHAAQQSAENAGMARQVQQQNIASGAMDVAQKQKAINTFGAYEAEQDPAKKAALLETYHALTGKGGERWNALHAAGGTDPNDPLRKLPDQIVLASDRGNSKVLGPGAAQPASAPSFNSKADLQAAIKAGKVKPGQTVMTPNGLMVAK